MIFKKAKDKKVIELENIITGLKEKNDELACSLEYCEEQLAEEGMKIMSLSKMLEATSSTWVLDARLDGVVVNISENKIGFRIEWANHTGEFGEIAVYYDLAHDLFTLDDEHIGRDKVKAIFNYIVNQADLKK